MKKLLIATDSYRPWWDGVTRSLSEIIPRLKQHYEITVLCPNFGPYEEEGIRLQRLPLSKIQFKEITGGFQFSSLQSKVIKKAVQENDIIFNQDLGPIGTQAIRYAKKLGKPCASYVHALEWERVPAVLNAPILKYFTRRIMKYLTRKLYNQCNLLITPSETLAEVLTWQGIRTPKMVARLGVDAKKFMPGKNKPLRKSLGIKDKDIVIGYHGRIAREKDLPTLLRAFVRLRNQYPNLKLLIVGEGLKLLTWKLEHQKGVILAGQQNNVVPYLQAMDIYCLTSLSETTSLSTLEAMSCGLPVIATPVGFVKDYIRHKENGLLIPKKNSPALASRIEYLLQHPEERKRIGDNARKTVEKEFQWEHTAEEILKALKSLEA